MQSPKNILVFVMNINESMVRDVRTYEKANKAKYRVMLLWDSKVKGVANKSGYDILVECDFSKPGAIEKALLPYEGELLAVTCRSEAHIARFAQVIPNVPYLRTPTTESLGWAADKYEMRKRLNIYDKRITPRFSWVHENTKKERARVIDKVQFPMIIKPANLAGSRFVAICYHEEELEKTLRTTFRKLRTAYSGENRKEHPKVVAEEYMEGQQYSIDVYVNSRGGVTFCPLVRQKTAREIGHDDFYTYLQITPTALKKSTVEAAEAVAKSAVHALGLRSVTAHVELLRVDDEWKVVEVGARCGGFRDVLHGLSCDINHTMNDIAVRIPRKPVVPKKCKGYAAAMKWFTMKEGVITEMQGIKKVEELASFQKIVIRKKVGDRAYFAKNGGISIFNLFLYNTERSKLLADIRRVEQMVEIKVANGAGGAKKAAKKSVKKAAVRKKVSSRSKAKK